MTGPVPSCPICGQAGPREPELRLQHDLYRCARCGLLYSGRTGDPDSARYYRDDEEGFFDRPYFDSPAAVREHPEHPNYRRALERLRSVLSIPSPRLLDVGCGTGALLQTAAELGFRAEGLEVSERVAGLGRAAGFEVHLYGGDFERLPETGPYDAVVFWDVLEHLARPVQALKAVTGRLRPGGAVLVRTINEDCLLSGLSLFLARLGLPAAARRMREPYHVVYFTPATLEACLGRAGLHVVERWAGEFPVERVTRDPFVRAALRAAYVAQALARRPYEQYAIARGS